MQLNSSYQSCKKLDSYSALICSKYFKNDNDFVNLICVNSKFKETTEKFRYNPIPIKSLQLFPKIQTQYLYDKNNKIIKRNSILKYEVLYEINYDEYLKQQKINTKYHYVVYTQENRIKYGDVIPDGVTILGDNCFGDKSNYDYNFLEDNSNVSEIHEISIVSTIKSLRKRCFNSCSSLTSINLPSTITSLGDYCFNHCSSLQSINLPLVLTSLGDACFSNCSSLMSIYLPPSITSLCNKCFVDCSSLTLVDLPYTMKSLGEESFSNCYSLRSINLPSTLTSLGNKCFCCCVNLISINLPSTLKIVGDLCFNNCRLLSSINLPSTLESLGYRCFNNCTSAKSISLPTYITMSWL